MLRFADAVDLNKNEKIIGVLQYVIICSNSVIFLQIILLLIFFLHFIILLAMLFLNTGRKNCFIQVMIVHKLLKFSFNGLKTGIDPAGISDLDGIGSP